LIDPKQGSPAIEPSQPVFFNATFRTHVQQKLVLGDPKKGIAGLSLQKRLRIEKWISSRSKKLHGESNDRQSNDFFNYVGREVKKP
jgi:hypothetical protein